jgi:hypothetical protein
VYHELSCFLHCARDVTYPCIFDCILVFAICCPYKVVVRNFSLLRKFLLVVSR